MAIPATRLRGLSRRAALAALAGLLLLTLALLVAAGQYTPPRAAEGPGTRTSDAVTYEHIVERMKAGESYYRAAHQELLAGNYGTRSVLNWRTPLYPTLESLLPHRQDARFLLLALALGAALCIGKPILDSAGIWVGAPLAVALALSLGGCASSAGAMFSEVPCGLLILLAVGLYALGWRRSAVVAAMLALFIRELAAPFVLILLADSARQRRSGELRLWAVLLVGYAVYFALHAYMVSQTIGPMDKAYPQGWLAFGGLGFVLATAQANGIFWLLAMQATAILLPLALLGLAAWPAPAGALAFATVCVYLAAFLVVGKPANVYWGLVYTPLLGVGLGWAPAALADLWRVLTRAAPVAAPG